MQTYNLTLWATKTLCLHKAMFYNENSVLVWQLNFREFGKCERFYSRKETSMEGT